MVPAFEELPLKSGWRIFISNIWFQLRESNPYSQVSSLEMFVNDRGILARHLEFPKQQKINYFIFGLLPKLKQALLFRQPQTYVDAVSYFCQAETPLYRY